LGNREISLGEITQIESGQAAPKESEFGSSGFPFIRAGHLESLIAGSNIDKLPKISHEVAKRKKLKLLPPNSILFAKSGMSATKNRVFLNSQTTYFVSHLAAIMPNDQLEPKYIEFFLNWFKPSRLIIDESYPSIRLSDIEKIKLKLPSINEQKQIAEILDKADALCQKDKKIIEKYDQLTQSVFLDMFGDPVSNTRKWSIKKFVDIGSLERGISKHRPRNAPQLLGGNYPLVQTGGIANSGIFLETYKSTYSEMGLKQSKIWPKGTLCITIAANIAKAAILNFDSCFPDSVVGFIPNNNTNTIFIYFWLSFWQEILEEKAPESAQKNINLKILRELDVPMPPIELQNRFAEVVEKIEKQKQLAQKSLEKSEQLFQSLLQKAFKGELV